MGSNGVLRGIVTAMVTPLDDSGELDLQGTERLLEHLISGGVHGIFVLGTTGEAPALTHRQREELVRFVCNRVDGRLPVLVGVTDTSFEEAVALSQAAAEAGAYAIVTAPPFYYQLSQEDLLRHCVNLASASELPLFLYNAPSNTHHVLEPQTVVRAADYEKIIGIKDSGFNMGYLHTVQQMLQGRSDFTFLVGPEELLAETVLLGGHGGMAAGSNVHPRLFVDLYEAAFRGDLEETNRLHAQVLEFGTALYGSADYTANPFRGLKCALAEMRICGDYVLSPMVRYTAQERQIVSEFLERHQLRASVLA